MRTVNLDSDWHEPILAVRPHGHCPSSCTGWWAGLVPSALVPLAIFASILLFPAGWVALGISALRTDRAGASFEGAIS